MIKWDIALYALGFTALLSILFGLIKDKKKSEENPRLLSNFLLADKSLSERSVIQLLFSTSFSLNGMLYQAWLGYSIGLWGLLIQGVWAISYVLLAKHSESIRSSNGLHSFLGEKFGNRTKFIAGICSIIGMLLLVGWEFNVGRSTFAGIIENSSPTVTTIFMFLVVIVCFIYTASGGLKSNAYSNYFQNGVKLLVFSILIGLLCKSFSGSHGSISHALFPSLKVMLENLGILGLITNVAFSLVWQFVDMSTWQNVVGSTKTLNLQKTKNALYWSGIAVFVAPGIIGTAIGALLHGTLGVNQDNIIASILSVLKTSNPFMLFLVLSAIFFAIMSTIDGLILAAGYAFVCDIIFRKTSLETLDMDKTRAEKIIVLIRFVLLGAVVLGTLGVYYMNSVLKIELFDLTYIMIVAQLTLFGPVAVGLSKRKNKTTYMNWSIYSALFIGFGCYFWGRHIDSDILTNGAGLFALMSSYTIAKIIS